jgi:vancomycin permeability regulator SanA
MKKFLKLFKPIIFLFLTWFIIHTAIIVFDGLHDHLQIADVGIVLGNKVNPDGQPSLRLQSRLDKAIELYRQGFFHQIIVSGGIGKEGYDEAKVMADYLVRNKIPAEIIIQDNQGANTFLTALNSKKLLRNPKSTSVLIVTQFYHITRTRLAFSKVGFKKIYTAHAAFFEFRDLYSLVREFFG